MKEACPKLTLYEWIELTKNGEKIPVVTTLNGNSMAPLIRKNKDIVTIIPVSGELKTGQIVVYKLFNDVCVAHRIYKINNDEVITLGDNSPRPDFPVKREMIIGIVTQVQRGKIKINLNCKAQYIYSVLWNHLLKKIWNLYNNLRKKIGQTIRKK